MTMKMKNNVKLGFIKDIKARKATSKRKARAVLKKLDDLVELCNVKTCLIFYLRPSREGTEELCSKFMNLSVKNQTKKMVNQRITKPDKEDGEESLRKKGESSPSCFPPPPVVYQPWYIRRKRGESSLPHRPDVFQTWYNNKMQSERLHEYYAQRLYAFNMTHNLHQNLNLNQNLNLSQNQNLNLNENQYQKEPFKFNYQALYDFYDSIPQKLEAFNKKYNLNANHNLVPYVKNTDPETNPSLNGNQGFMDASEEQMDDAGEDGDDVSSVDSSTTPN